MIGMIVCPDHRVDIVDIGGEQLFAHVGRRVDQDARRLRLDDDRHTRSTVARISGIAGTPIIADPRHARRGAAPENANFHAFVFVKRSWKLRAVAPFNSSRSSPRRLARNWAVSATKLGSPVLPRWGTGARNGASVSISRRSIGSAAAVACKSLAFLNVTMPEIEM